MSPPFPALPDSWPATRETLHRYANAIGVVPRAHGIAHPQWWHISLKVRPDGLTTDNVPLPGGGVVALRLDLRRHQLVISSSDGSTIEFPLGEGITATEMGDRVIAAATGLGLPTDGYARERFESDDPRSYDPAAAETFFAAAVNAATVFEHQRALRDGRVGPVQLWPHGFDLAFEWFGTRVDKHEENGEVVESPSQINLGFYPGAEAYFYSNPWPFEPALLGHLLPHGAEWEQDDFQGTKLDYALVAGDPDGAAKLADYAQTVYEVAAPTLLT